MAIYAWPPVGLKTTPVWTVRDPVNVSRSVLGNGPRYTSSHARRRIYAAVSVSARRGQVGAGYMEALKRLLEGGAGQYVRLWHRPRSPVSGRARALAWRGQGAALDWSAPPGAVSWYGGAPARAEPVTDGGLPAIRVTGLPPGAPVCIPGELVSIGAAQRMTLTETRASGAGVAVIRLDRAFAAGGPCIIGAVETGIFEVLDLPETGGPRSEDYTYDWSFLQVFEDEFPEPQLELNPWTGG